MTPRFLPIHTKDTQAPSRLSRSATHHRALPQDKDAWGSWSVIEPLYTHACHWPNASMFVVFHRPEAGADNGEVIVFVCKAKL